MGLGLGCCCSRLLPLLGPLSMCPPCNPPLPQAEALAKTYGRKQLLNRFASEVLSLMTNQARRLF